jgi:hypothetical protein
MTPGRPGMSISPMLPNTTDAIRGRIYKITAPGCTKVYIGSTCLTLAQRLSQHRLDLRKWQRSRGNFVTSYDVLDHLGAEIHLLEEGEFTKQHMREREAHWIRSLPSVNRRVPGRSPAESRRISHATKVACPTCGKHVRRDYLKKHASTRKCSLASNAAPQLVEALAGVGTV